ncbi:MAG: 2-dehydro-3-deoxyphosphogluconate aldolase [Microbacterium sp.]|jgi:2-dehydro-3-deoxyphosphogluconate aldolase/(4S)-4-hydroxy-2-oxoglutarate aldolase|nr:2-dehydro-3-deoxyphosphogluconate aldolase [Microbacterium sp.]
MRPTSALSRVTAVLRAPVPVDHEPVVDALIEEGVGEIELTFTTPGALEALPALRRRFGTGARIGMGSVTTAERVGAALDAGAQFLVTPGALPEVVPVAHDRGVPVMMGAFSPTEVMAALNAKADVVKIFPASLVGPDYLTQLRGPFPDLRAVPSGGIGPEDAAAWLRAGAFGVSMGGPLLGDALRGGSIHELKLRLWQTAEALDRARGGR